MKTRIAVVSSLLIAATLIGAQDNVEKKQLTHEAIHGAWELKFEDGSKRTKFIGGGLWTITQCDPKTGTVVFHHGGTYTLDGANYTETVVFANENTSNLKGNSHKFELTIEGDVIHQKGIGNSWNEAWNRIKP
ncbi:MAG: hypothetical protein V4819_25045 [Verrucomicrobiota bacterium]